MDCLSGCALTEIIYSARANEISSAGVIGTIEVTEIGASEIVGIDRFGLRKDANEILIPIEILIGILDSGWIRALLEFGIGGTQDATIYRD